MRPIRSQPSVSVIVPAYNVEAYLERCLDSLRAQTLGDLEAIVVLDAPTDDTARIAMRYADEFTILPLPENVGLPGARNAGIAVASGKFVRFVDADDWVAPTMFQRLLNAAEREDADVASCGITKVGDNDSSLADLPFPPTDDLAHGHSTRLFWFVWRNLYRRSMPDEHGMSFDPALRAGEDMPFNIAAFVAARRHVTVDESLYFYRQTPDSLTRMRHLPYLPTSLQAAYERKVEAGHVLGDTFLADTHLYTVENLMPRLLSNALSDPQLGSPYEAVVGVMMLPFIREAVACTTLTAPLPTGQRLRLLPAKLGQYRLLTWLHQRSI